VPGGTGVNPPVRSSPATSGPPREDFLAEGLYTTRLADQGRHSTSAPREVLLSIRSPGPRHISGPDHSLAKKTDALHPTGVTSFARPASRYGARPRRAAPPGRPPGRPRSSRHLGARGALLVGAVHPERDVGASAAERVGVPGSPSTAGRVHPSGYPSGMTRVRLCAGPCSSSPAHGQHRYGNSRIARGEVVFPGGADGRSWIPEYRRACSSVEVPVGDDGWTGSPRG